jgi:hypothetical protein
MTYEEQVAKLTAQVAQLKQEVKAALPPAVKELTRRSAY